jgi:hypothetical protein
VPCDRIGKRERGAVKETSSRAKVGKAKGEFTVWNEKNVRTPENERRRGQTKESEV